MNYNTFEFWQIFLGGLCTLAIFSFLYRENPVYRFFEHLFIGIATSYGVITVLKESLWPKVFRPLFGFERVLYPDGTYVEPYNSNYYLFLIPMAFGSLYYFVMSRKYNWLAQLVIGVSFGAAAGNSFKGLFAELIPQVTDSFRPLYVADSWLTTFNNIIFIFTITTAMSYFFFTFSRKRAGLIERASYAGRWMMMGCFGAFFGSTVMARMALLVERLNFLITKWWPSLF
ncbi:MAG: hypothetical protein KBC84_02865 [Proteobacteria bacterium]|nr:hypothetical protein [Pseudomonadota bacterium]